MKKVLFFGLLLLLSGCQTQLGGHTPHPQTHAQIPTQAPKHIALLLPSSGNIAAQAKAIENGFFASYYQDQNTTEKPQITVLDTEKTDITAAYQAAVNKGANLVVGPLLKPQVQTLKQKSPLPVPVLALNTVAPVSYKQPNNFFEFGLSPQDEAVQIAQKMRRDGFSRVLIISPDSAWSEGVTQTFIAHFQKQGGSISDRLKLTPHQDLSSAVRALLHFQGDRVAARDDENAARATSRRRDFDAVFMLAAPTEARQIVPLIKYYDGQDIAIYASSLIYAGNSPNPADKDLEGVIFCDMPSQLSAANHTSNSRLYALGQDAYLLTKQLHSLVNGNTMPGNTGQLYMDSNLQIHRNLNWAEFHDGVAEPRG